MINNMNMITVEKADLIKKLKKNRKKHREVFEAAIEGYRKAVIAELERMISRAKAGKKIEQYINLPQPEDHTKDYDIVIEMLEMDVGDQITLTTQQYTQYVRDDWGWKEQFMNTSSSYTNIR